MSKFRFSLGSLMGAVAIAALISGTIKLLLSVNEHIELTLILGIPLGLLEAALLGVVFCGGLARKFWIGFAVFGWITMCTVFFSGPLWSVPINWTTEQIYDRMAGWRPSQFGPITLDWMAIGHSLQWCLPLGIFLTIPIVMGFIGGRRNRRYHARGDDKIAETEKGKAEV